MALRRDVRFALVLALSLGGGAACGTRTSMLYDYAAAADAGADVLDALDAADALDATPPPPTCKWGVGPTTQITTAPDDHELTSAIHVAGGALIGTMSSDDPARDRNWTITPLAADGTLAGAPIAALENRPNGLSVGGLSIADGPIGRAALAWDTRNLCRFVTLDPVTTQVTAVTQITKEYCTGLHASPRGYRYIESDLSPGYTHRLALQEPGVTRVGDALAPLADKAYWFSVVGAPDGATIAAWIAEGRTPARIVAGWALDDVVLETTVEGPTIDGKGRWIRLAPTATGTHVVWLDGPATATTASVRYATLDRVARTFDAGHLVTDQAFRDAGAAVGTIGGDVLVAWMEGDATHAQRLYVQALKPDGTPRADKLLVSSFFVGSSPRLVATSLGAIVVYMAEPTAQPMQVFATSLVCPP
jgi:hypothetical protein